MYCIVCSVPRRLTAPVCVLTSLKLRLNEGFRDDMEITITSSPEVNTYMSDRIKVAGYHAIYINFRKLVKAK